MSGWGGRRNPNGGCVTAPARRLAEGLAFWTVAVATTVLVVAVKTADRVRGRESEL